MPDPVPLFAVNQFAPTADAKAAFLERLAEEVRSGEVVMQKAVLVYIDGDGLIQYEPFGNATTTAELAGMLAFAQHKVISV